MRQLKKCTLCPAITKQPVRHLNKVHKDHPARYQSSPLQINIHKCTKYVYTCQIIKSCTVQFTHRLVQHCLPPEVKTLNIFFLLIQCSFDAYFLLCFTLLSYKRLHLRKNFLIVIKLINRKQNPALNEQKKER